MVLAASDDCFDRELAGWFVRHGGGWTGTAAELVTTLKAGTGVENDLWPQSFRELYSHIESHRQVLSSLGVDAVLHDGHPRMISLRSCPEGKLEGESSPGTPTKSDVITEPVANAAYSEGDNFGEGIFKSAGDALFALMEMRMQIRERGLQLESAIDLVVGRTQEITRSSGVAVGLLRQDTVVYPARTGVAASMAALEFQPNLFQICLKTGRTLQLRDAQNHPRVGAACRREGIGSVILVPLFHNREVAGAIEFLFKERRSFSIGDVMDLELIAGVISESLRGTEPMGLKQAGGRECLVQTEPVENVESQVGDSLGASLNEKLSLVQALADSFPDATDANLATAPATLRVAVKKAWMRCARVMGTRSA